MRFEKCTIPTPVMQILNRLNDNGYASYIVGGAVRDLLLGRKPKDFDICTAATPDQVKSLFPKVIDTGLKFGTVTVLAGKTAVEVTTFRTGVIFADGQRQGVDFGHSVRSDVEARDFTVNALLFDGNEIIDLVGGLEDLQVRRIRAVLLADLRFKEDALRMMRAIRLCCQLHFSVEPNTRLAILKHAELIKKVSPERIRDELIKIVTSDFPAKGMELLQETGLLKHVLPELASCYRFEQHNLHHDKDVFAHTMAVLDNTGNDPILRLAALFHDMAKPEVFTLDEQGVGHFYMHHVKGEQLCKRVMNRLKFDNKTTRSVSKLVREHMYKLQVIRKTKVKRMINRVGRENIFRLLDLQKADEIASAPPHNLEKINRLQSVVEEILDNREPLEIKDLSISGKDLIELGFEPGPQVGKALKQLLTLVLSTPELNDKERLLQIAAKMGR